MDHDDIEGELVLAALGGDKAECVAMLEAWGTHADDLDVLALGPRSPADELAVTPELVDELRAALGPAARSVPMRPWPAPGPASGGGPGGRAARAHPGPRRQDQGRGAYAAPGSGSLRGGVRPGARALRGMPGRRLSPEQERARARRVELLSLFALGRDFQLRLSAQVAAAWSGRRARRAGPRPGERPAGPGGGPGRRWPRRPGPGPASTPTRSGPPCTRGPAGEASRGTGPGCGRPFPSAGWPGCGRRVSRSPTVTWSWTCWR